MYNLKKKFCYVSYCNVDPGAHCSNTSMLYKRLLKTDLITQYKFTCTVHVCGTLFIGEWTQSLHILL